MTDIDPAAAHRLLVMLKTVGYAFITPTPATHRRFLRRREGDMARHLRDILGWSLPFQSDVIPAEILAAMWEAGLVENDRGRLRSIVRISSLGSDLFLHSAYPPSAEDAVFFGPDTYRFARFIGAELSRGPAVSTVVDIGTGSGAGAAVAFKSGRATRAVAMDINLFALQLAQINLAAAGVKAECRLGSGIDNMPPSPDVIVANPPFIAGAAGRTYRDGGDMHGARLSLEWALAGAERLPVMGRFLLYTGATIVDGHDGLEATLRQRLNFTRFSLDYNELDPDIFGGLLGSEGYQDAERIAAVGAVITRLA